MAVSALYGLILSPHTVHPVDDFSRMSHTVIRPLMPFIEGLMWLS